MTKYCLFSLFMMINALLFLCAGKGLVEIDAKELPVDVCEAVQADWLREEQRLGRNPTDLDVIDSLFERATQVIDSWERLPDAPMLVDVSVFEKELIPLQERAKQYRTQQNVSEEDRLALYLDVRHVVRRLALSHPLLQDRPLVFIKQKRAICQMFHEYSGYYFDWFGISGGGIFILQHPGQSFETTELTKGLLPNGSYTSPALSWDGKTIFFSFCEVKSGERPWGNSFDPHKLPSPPQTAPNEYNYYTDNRAAFHLFAIDTDGTHLRQLTDGLFDDLDPCELPDGRIAFMTTRRGGFVRCNSNYEPLETSTMHVVDRDGKNIQRLSWHETNEWHPSVLPDGRILYIRWDYVDRDATLFHGIWSSNPDGTAPTHLFGSYTDRINAHYQPRSVPHTKKIICLAGAHHANVGGSLILVDTEKITRDEITGEDSLDCIERLTPEICFSEVDEQWAKSYYSSPVPLSEDHYLVAFSYEPLPGMGSGWYGDSRSSLYYFDRFGNRELLYDDPEFSSVAPMPLANKQGELLFKKPPVVPSIVDQELAEQSLGEYHLSNVYLSQLPMPTDREIKSLRIFQLLPKSETHAANVPRIGHANGEPSRALLGEVPVESDGSAYFQAPACKPLFFQAIDTQGKAVQGMHSVSYLQPGEKRACVGCHEPINQAAAVPVTSLAGRRAPSAITPIVGEYGPLGFSRMIQPILDRRCVHCHHDLALSKETSTHQEHLKESRQNAKAAPNFKPNLEGTATKQFSTSYESLRPYLRWYEWGKNSISQILSEPGKCGADASPLTNILDDKTHRKIEFPDHERRLLYLWLDGNVPFYGTNDPLARQQQLSGENIPMPLLQ